MENISSQLEKVMSELSYTETSCTIHKLNIGAICLRVRDRDLRILRKTTTMADLKICKILQNSNALIIIFACIMCYNLLYICASSVKIMRIPQAIS